MQFWRLLPLVLLVALFSCESAGSEPEAPQEPDQPAKSADGAPAPPAQARVVEVTPDTAAVGKEEYKVCAGCHGAEGEGKVGMAPRLVSKSFLAAASDEYLIKTIKEGREGTTMIPWGATLDDTKIKAIIAHLRSMELAEPAELDESELKGDAEAGKKLFAEICAACHGAAGAGYMETANGTGIGRKGFLNKATNGFVRYMARNGKSGTAMRPMQGARNSVADLSDEEIDSVIKYLRASAW